MKYIHNLDAEISCKMERTMGVRYLYESQGIRYRENRWIQLDKDHKQAKLHKTVCYICILKSHGDVMTEFQVLLRGNIIVLC
jgi:hypothetical protein